MKIFSIAKKSLTKFSKGFILCAGIFCTTAIFVQSCKKTEVTINDNAAQKFLSALNESSKQIKNISVITAINSDNLSNTTSLRRINLNQKSNSSSLSGNSGLTSAFILFKDMIPINPNYSSNIMGIANLVTDYQGEFTQIPSINCIQFSVNLETVNASLQPLISEAKTYLNMRGLTNTDINEMITEEGGQEVDLVPFAATLAKYEVSGQLAKATTPNIFFSFAYAGDPDILHCVGVALGVNHLWALGGSNAKSWTKKAIKQAFGAVVKRALGPIGAAIAVVSFGLCMGDFYG